VTVLEFPKTSSSNAFWQSEQIYSNIGIFFLYFVTVTAAPTVIPSVTASQELQISGHVAPTWPYK
jgi:hypothetical protein